MDLLAVCSVGNPARSPEWVLLADSLVLAKTCVSEPVWQLCAAMATRFSSADGGGEEERAKSAKKASLDQICEREKGWEKQRVAGPGDKFQPILCAREGSSDRHGGRISRYETRSRPEAERGRWLLSPVPPSALSQPLLRLEDVVGTFGSATEFGARRGLVTDAWT